MTEQVMEKITAKRRIRNQTMQSALVDHETRVMALELDRRLLDSAQGLADIVQGLLTRIEVLENKATRLEHHFVTLDKQMSKQARHIEELENQPEHDDGKNAFTDNNGAETSGPLNRKFTPDEWKEFEWARPPGPGGATVFAQCPGCGFLMIDSLYKVLRSEDGRLVQRVFATCGGCGGYTLRGVVKLVNVAAGEADGPMALTGEE